ncbi:uncharacterized protein K441DRAFT_309754 [Cenococcum geophilum 1.58]|uniref:uncharacterized protein n=1 Tax=Cenococcum geophilum 1.58 TaxID=794803 RepID=UPI00358EED0A|nr:hypothetical protein K441DRAFT_309754 [Cenococcum geophilum 1.58]
MRAVRKRIRSRAPGGLWAVRLSVCFGGFLGGGARFTTVSWGSYGMGTGDVVLTENWCCVLSCPRTGSLNL